MNIAFEINVSPAWCLMPLKHMHHFCRGKTFCAIKFVEVAKNSIFQRRFLKLMHNKIPANDPTMFFRGGSSQLSTQSRRRRT